MMTHWIFDLDDTIFDNSHRRHYIERPVPDWDGFHQTHELVRDVPKAWTAGLFGGGLFRYGYHAFLTARDERAREGSTEALRRHGMLHAWRTPLMMKPQGPETALPFKLRMLLMLTQTMPDTPIVFVEDRADIIEAARSMGVDNLRVVDALREDLREEIERIGDTACPLR